MIVFFAVFINLIYCVCISRFIWIADIVDHTTPTARKQRIGLLVQSWGTITFNLVMVILWKS